MTATSSSRCSNDAVVVDEMGNGLELCIPHCWGRIDGRSVAFAGAFRLAGTQSQWIGENTGRVAGSGDGKEVVVVVDDEVELRS